MINFSYTFGGTKKSYSFSIVENGEDFTVNHTDSGKSIVEMHWMTIGFHAKESNIANRDAAIYSAKVALEAQRLKYGDELFFHALEGFEI